MLKSSVGRKIIMALSGIFLIIFLTQHLLINITSIFESDGQTFNKLSHFMGTNPIVQFVLQPILILGVIIHFSMGIYLEILNQRSRQISYVKYSGKSSSSWASRNMIISGLVILSFLFMHFYDFWIPEINTKYIQGDWTGMHDGEFRYFHELQLKFKDQLFRVVIYCISFILLGMHLVHGLGSSLQSMGVTKGPIKLISTLFSILVPFGFIFIAVFHYLN